MQEINHHQMDKERKGREGEGVVVFKELMERKRQKVIFVDEKLV